MTKKILIVFGFLLTSFAGITLWIYYNTFVKNIELKNEESCILYISSETTWEEISKQIQNCFDIKHTTLFNKIAQRKSLPQKFKKGYYKFSKPLPLNKLFNTIKYGHQTPVNIVFNSIRNLPELAGIVANQMMFDSSEIASLFKNIEVIESYGFDSETFPTMFIPNTYELYWTTSPVDFIKRMYAEHQKFWNKQRLMKAENLKLSTVEINILASIVEKETAIKSEMPTVAGVYLNRIRKKIPLQADPTIIFAMGDFSIRRVTHRMLETNSPYNTYKYKGLPPGPICIPSSHAIDAILNYEKHEYLYFCASPSLDGSHIFAKTLRQHNQNAEEYRRTLNKLKIFK